jgi:hypothetical protein
MPAFTQATKVFDPIANKVIQAEFIQTMIAEHPLFANYYDIANVKVDGGTAKFIGGQQANGSPRKWKRGFSRANWPNSENFEQSLELVEYGLFGDMTSQDFGRLAFDDPGMLGQVFDAKIEGVLQQWKRAIETHILYLICDKANYKDDTGFIELDEGYFDISTDHTEIGACQARALAFITDVERKAYDFLEYSKDFNQADKEAATKSLKNITMIFHPRVNTFLNTYAYSSAQNAGYIELRQKLGKLIVKKLPNWEVDDVAYRTFSADGVETNITAAADRQAFNWAALIHDTNFYKIRDAINHPGNDDVFIDSKDYNIDLTSYVGKWWFCFEGVIKFVNACAWVEERPTPPVE